MGDFFIDIDELRRRLGSPGAPVIFDVRRRAAFDSDDRVIPTARWRDHGRVDDWAASLPSGVPVVVYCVHGHQVSQAAAAALRARDIPAQALRHGIEGWREVGAATVLKDAVPNHDRALGPGRWVTGTEPGIDRIACSWFLRRFVDRDARIYFVEAAQVEASAVELGAVPFGVPGVAYGHHGGGCGFEVFLDRFGIDDPALSALAGIVRGAEQGRSDPAPESAGLLALSRGISVLADNEREVLERGLALFDALYAWSLSERRQEP